MKKLTAAEQTELDKIAAEAELKAADKLRAIELGRAYNTDLELWRTKNLVNLSAFSVALKFAEGSETMRAQFTANYDGKVRELSRAQDTALERSHAELAALNWEYLQLLWLHRPVDGSFKLLDFWDRRLAAAQREFERECLTLAKLRRLALPVLLVNYADKQQVNIGFVSKAPKGKG